MLAERDPELKARPTASERRPNMTDYHAAPAARSSTCPAPTTRALEKARTLPPTGYPRSRRRRRARRQGPARENVVDGGRTRAATASARSSCASTASDALGHDDAHAAAARQGRRDPGAQGRERRQIERWSTIARQAGAPESMRIWCMMETPLGILHAERDRERVDRASRAS